MPATIGGVADVRWLGDEEMRAWRAFVEGAQLLLDRIDRELQRDSGLTSADYEILVRLSEQPDRRMRMSSLADEVLSSRSRLTHQVKRMEERGLVRREGCPEDRRGAYAVLTDAGLSALQEAAPGHVAAVRAHLLDLLTARQVRQVGEIFERVRGHLDADR